MRKWATVEMIKRIPEVCRDQRKNLACEATGQLSVLERNMWNAQGRKDKRKIHLGWS